MKITIAHLFNITKTKFNNLIILAGIFVSIFALTYMHSEAGATNDLSGSGPARIQYITSVHTSDMKNVKRGHNFLASYFLQESSVERKKAEPEDEKLAKDMLFKTRNAIMLWVRSIL